MRYSVKAKRLSQSHQGMEEDVQAGGCTHQMLAERLPICRKKQSFLSQLTEALDFAQVRSEADRDLLDKANSSMGRKGKAASSGGPKQKLSKEQYQ